MNQKRFTFGYQNKIIDYDIWFTGDSKTLNTIIFLGSVQIGKLPEWVAEACPPRTAIVQGAPHWHAMDNGQDIPEYMYDYTRNALEGILTHHTFDSLKVIADSQAVPGVLRLFAQSDYRSHLQSIVLLQPLGLTAAIFGDEDKQRIERFKNRVIKNTYHQLTPLLLDSHLRYNHRLLRRTVGFRDPKAEAQYNSGLKHDSLPDLKHLVMLGSKITIVCGANDRIFPPNEIQASLEQEGLDISIVKIERVPHSPLATKQGLKLLKVALEV